MSQPDAVRSPAPKRKAIRPLVLGVALLLGLGAFVAIKLISSGAPQMAGVSGPVTNATQAVPLADFTQPQTRRWRSVPHGTQVCDRVTFICDGAIRTAGLGAARDGNHYPGAVLGVPVNRRGSRIHLLQSAENSTDMTEGDPYGRMVLHYANGESRKFDLLFGVHGDDWLQGKGKPSEAVADPNSKVAWVQRRRGDGMTIRFYHTVLENPLPEIRITTIDFISPLCEANLLLFGLTIDDDPRPLGPSYGPGETIGDGPGAPVTFSLQDAAGQPATAATLTWTAQGPRTRIDFPPFPADGLGQITIEVPRKSIRRIQYRAQAPDGSSISGELEANAAGSFPIRTVVKLSPPGQPLQAPPL